MASTATDDGSPRRDRASFDGRLTAIRPPDGAATYTKPLRPSRTYRSPSPSAARETGSVAPSAVRLILRVTFPWVSSMAYFRRDSRTYTPPSSLLATSTKRASFPSALTLATRRGERSEVGRTLSRGSGRETRPDAPPRTGPD